MMGDAALRTLFVEEHVPLPGPSDPRGVLAGLPHTTYICRLPLGTPWRVLVEEHAIYSGVKLVKLVACSGEETWVTGIIAIHWPCVPEKEDRT